MKDLGSLYESTPMSVTQYIRDTYLEVVPLMEAEFRRDCVGKPVGHRLGLVRATGNH